RHLRARRTVVGGRPGPAQRLARLPQRLGRRRRLVLRELRPRRRRRGDQRRPAAAGVGRLRRLERRLGRVARRLRAHRPGGL
ncbi:MAG: putative lipoprotein, partial [uncultured Friedmanniella sp.]